jgi:hypothetical protein
MPRKYLLDSCFSNFNTIINMSDNNRINKVLLASLTAQIIPYDSDNAPSLAEYILVLIRNGSSKEHLFREASSFVGNRHAKAILDWLFMEVKRLQPRGQSPEGKELDDNMDLGKVDDARNIIDEKRKLFNNKSKWENIGSSDEAQPSRGLEDLKPQDMQPLFSKTLTKCSYFPHCNDTSCTLVHPTELCKYFPNCQYGDSCIYIHPVLACRFQEKCKNPNCNYQHHSPATLQKLSSVGVFTRAKSTIVCRFGEKCRNENCSFMHPVKVPCRLGLACSDVYCPFEHPIERQAKTPCYSKINVQCRFGKKCAKADCPFMHTDCNAGVNNIGLFEQNPQPFTSQ